MGDFQKIAYFASWLGPGVPIKWFHGIERSQPAVLNNYLAFIKAFTNHFGDPDSVESAHCQLTALRQTGPASDYVARFREIAVHCEHSEYDMRRCFVQGLKHEVQLQMIQN